MPQPVAAAIALDTPRFPFSETEFTIRDLKAAVADLHKKFGALITKPAFGQRASDMSKFFLVRSLNKIQGILDCAPRTYQWSEVQESRRITTCRADGTVWTTAIGCVSEADAYKLYLSMLKPGRCLLAVVRKGSRTNYAWEVKIWGLNPLVLDGLIRKDTPILALQFALLEASNLDQRWSVHRPLPEGGRQFLGSVFCSLSNQWGHSRQPKLGQGIARYNSKEEAGEALSKVFDRQQVSHEQARISIFGV